MKVMRIVLGLLGIFLVKLNGPDYLKAIFLN